MKKLHQYCSQRVKDYFSFDKQIVNLKEQLEYEESNQGVNSFIKSKNKISNKVENAVIKRIMIENKINEKILWKSIIEDVIDGYRNTYKPKYDYIIEKYMYDKKDKVIETELFMSTTTQYRYKAEFLSQIAIIALSKNLIVLSEFENENKQLYRKI
jgi:RinA family phage transcriptional activator